MAFDSRLMWPLVLMALAASSVLAGKEVMIISSGHGAPDTRYLARNAAYLEQVPLDGVATWIATPVPVALESGGTLIPRLESGRLARIATGEDAADVGQTIVQRGRIPDSHVAPAIRDLQTADFKRFDSNLIHVIIGNAKEPFDWFDDNLWSAIRDNIGTVARAAKEGGCRGILVDPEVYSYPWWGHDQLKEGALAEVYADRDWDEVRTMARQRGREFAGAVCAEIEDPVIMFFTAVGYTARQIDDPRWDRPAVAPYGLMVPFVDGILEGSSAGTHFVDCNSDMKGRSEWAEFETARRHVKEDGLSFSQVPDLYRKKVKLGYTFRLGYHPREEEISGENRISGLFDPAWPESNFYSPDKLQQALQMALEIGDGYVLFWNYRASWWLRTVTDQPANGAPIETKTRWVPPVYWEAIERARASVAR